MEARSEESREGVLSPVWDPENYLNFFHAILYILVLSWLVWGRDTLAPD